VQYGAALALALAGDAFRAQTLADDLAKRFPEDTVVQFNYLPTTRAQLALNRSDPAKPFGAGSSKAIEALQGATAYELGNPGTAGFTPALYPVYVRGEAYLAAHRGGEAAAEFQKIRDHRGVAFNEPIGALAHLGLARAYVLQGDLAKARSAYQDFLTLWKDADPDTPILIAAKAEYARLQQQPESETRVGATPNRIRGSRLITSDRLAQASDRCSECAFAGCACRTPLPVFTEPE
jgi:tetratricopeptide (TPR) repeat protein